jgi:AAA family ATP:ADP antiporter
MMANIALIFSGQYVKYVSSLRTGLPAGTDPWGHSLKLLMGAVLAGGGVVIGLMAYMQNFVSSDTQCTRPCVDIYRLFTGSDRSCVR